MEFCIGTRDEMWTAEGDLTNVVSKIGREKDLRDCLSNIKSHTLIMT